MTFSGHISTAAVILTVTNDPLAVVAGCLVAHFVIDAIPHAEWRRKADSNLLAKTIMTADALATIILLGTMFLVLAAPIWLIITAVLVSILPDLTDKLARRYVRPLRYLHKLMHTWPLLPTSKVDWSKTVTGRTPTWVKVLTQFLLVAGAELWLIGRPNLFL